MPLSDLSELFYPALLGSLEVRGFSSTKQNLQELLDLRKLPPEFLGQKS